MNNNCKNIKCNNIDNLLYIINIIINITSLNYKNIDNI